MMGWGGYGMGWFWAVLMLGFWIAADRRDCFSYPVAGCLDPLQAGD